MPNSENKVIIQKNRFKSEYSMGNFHFERFDVLLKLADELGFEVRQSITSYNKTKSLYPYYSVLKQLYINLRPIVYLKIREEIDFYFEIIKKDLDNWFMENSEIKTKKEFTVPSELIEELEEMQIYLWELWQKCGLGLNVIRDMSTVDKIKNAK